MTLSVTRLLTDTVTIERCTDTTDYGTPVFSGSQVEIAARWEYGVRKIRSPDGLLLDISDRFACVEEIRPRDRVWAPNADTGDDEEARSVVTVEKGQTPSGEALTIAYLG